MGNGWIYAVNFEHKKARVNRAFLMYIWLSIKSFANQRIRGMIMN